MTATSFQELIRRMRAGDQAAVAELVRTYEKEIRRTIRVRLSDTRLRRSLDSMDICQSVLGNFFVRACAGQFDLDRPEQMLRLLIAMAHNKVIDRVRMEQARGLDRRQEGDSAVLAAVPARQESPIEIVAGKELLERARALLNAEERAIAEQRVQGRDWEAIAADLGRSPDAVRKQLERALERIVDRLGLDGKAAG